MIVATHTKGKNWCNLCWSSKLVRPT